MKIIITIPAYNEEKTLPFVLQEIQEVIKNSKDKKDLYEIVVVDDGSTDKTIETAKKHGATVISHRHCGLAETFKIEMQECLKRKADIIIHTDADGQYHSQHIPQLIEKIKHGYDLVLGSRFKKNNPNLPLTKILGNIAFAKVIGSLTRIKITDSTTGFRAFTPEIAAEISYINTFTYTQEQIIKAAKQGFKITEIPIQTRRTRSSRLFKSPFQYAVRAWTNIFRIYRDYDPLKFFGRIGGAVLLLGIIIGCWLVYRFLTLGYVGKTPTTFLSVLLMLMGIQIILFGFLADMMKNKN